MPKTVSTNQFKIGEAYLSRVDPLLGALIDRNGPIEHHSRTDYFASLARSIVGQQVSMSAASAIFGRFEIATGLRPAAVLAMSVDELRSAGLSRQKAAYLRDLAQHFCDNPAIFDDLDHLDDEDIITQLTAVKGIGVWTAQMFLIFTLVRPDVFAPDDVGLQRGIKLLYGMSAVPPKVELVALADKWRPYRTIASLHLWQSLK